MGHTAGRLIDTALAEEGYLEKTSNAQLDDRTANAGSGNYTKYARDLDGLPDLFNGKKQGFAWCAVWVVWCFVKAFGVAAAQKLLCLPARSLAAGCIYAVNYFKAKGQFHTEEPKPGDQIFFYNAKRTAAAHTGLVYEVDDTYVYTIEGNTSSEEDVVANGGGVWRKKYKLTDPDIVGYGRPQYDPEEQEAPGSAEAAAVGTEMAEHFDTAKAGSYKVKECSGLMFRTGPGTDREALAARPTGTVVNCLGYYTGEWLRVETADSRVGFCHGDYLVKG